MPWYTKALQDIAGMFHKPEPEPPTPTPTVWGAQRTAPPKPTRRLEQKAVQQARKQRPAPKPAWGAPVPAPRPADKPARKTPSYVTPKYTEQITPVRAKRLERKLEKALPPVQGPKSLSELSPMERLVHPIWRAVKEAVPANVGLVANAYAATTSPVNYLASPAGKHLREQFPFLETVQKGMRPLNVFNMPGSYLAASIEAGRLEDPLDEWERQLYPHLMGKEHALSMTLGKTTEEATGSQTLGQIAATAGWAGDIFLSADNLIASAFSKGQFITRGFARKSAGRAVSQATHAAAKDIGLSDMTASRVARGITRSVHYALGITEDAVDAEAALKNIPPPPSGNRPFGGEDVRKVVEPSQVAPFEPSRLGWGIARDVERWGAVVEESIREQAPKLGDEEVGRLRDKVVANLQHQWGPEAWRVAGRRTTKAPDEPILNLHLQQDIASANKQAARIAKMMLGIDPQKPETYEPLVEKWRRGELRSIDDKTRDTQHEIEVHLERAGAAREAQKAETNTYRSVLKQQVRAIKNAERDVAKAEEKLALAQQQARDLPHLDLRATIEQANKELEAARAVQQSTKAAVIDPAVIRANLPDVSASGSLTEKEINAAARQTDKIWQQIFPVYQEWYGRKWMQVVREFQGQKGWKSAVQHYMRQYRQIKNGNRYANVGIRGAAKMAAERRADLLALVPESNGYTFDQLLKSPSRGQLSADSIYRRYYESGNRTGGDWRMKLAVFYGGTERGYAELAELLLRRELGIGNVTLDDVLDMQRKWHLDDRGVMLIEEQAGIHASGDSGLLDEGIMNGAAPELRRGMFNNAELSDAAEDAAAAEVAAATASGQSRAIREAEAQVEELSSRIATNRQSVEDYIEHQLDAETPGISPAEREQIVNSLHAGFAAQERADLDEIAELQEGIDAYYHGLAADDQAAEAAAKERRRAARREKRGPKPTPEMKLQAVREKQARIEDALDVLIEEAKADPALAEKMLDAHAAGALIEDRDWAQILDEQATRQGDLDNALSELERTTANVGELQEARAKIIRDATEKEYTARTTRHIRQQAEKATRQRLPKRVTGDVDELIERVREAWTGPGELPPGLERTLRSRRIASLRARMRGLEKEAQQVNNKSLDDVMAEIVGDLERSHVESKLRGGVRSNAMRVLNLIQPNREVPREFAAEMARISDKAEEILHRRGAVFSSVFEGIDAADATTMGLMLPIRTGYYNMQQAGQIPAGFRWDPDPENALQLVFNRLADKDPKTYGALRAADFFTSGPEPELLVEKLPQRARTLWERSLKQQEVQEGFFWGSDKFPWSSPQGLLMNMLAEEMGTEPVGHLGPGYQMYHSLPRVQPNQLRAIMSGSLADDEALRIGLTTAEEEVEHASFANALERISKWVIEGKRAEGLTNMPVLDAREVTAQWCIRAYRNELMHGYRQAVKRWGADITKMSAAEVAALKSAGWAPPSWPGSKKGENIPWKGLEHIWVDPGMQSVLARKNLEGTIDWVLPKMAESIMNGILKPTVLFSGVFAAAQVFEVAEDFAKAYPHARKGAFRSIPYTTAALSGVLGELATTGDFPTAARRLEGWLHKGVSTIWDALFGHIGSPQRRAEYEARLAGHIEQMRDILNSSAPAQWRDKRKAVTSVQWPDWILKAKPAVRAGKEIGGVWDAVWKTWFIVDSISQASIYVALREAGESDEMARQILRSVKVNYRASGAAPVDHFLQKIWWFSRYFTERTRQYAAEVQRRPGLVVAAYEAARKAQKNEGVSTGTQIAMSGRPAFMKSDPSIMPLPYDLPVVRDLHPDNYPAMVAVDGPWLMYGRVRLPGLEWAGDMAEIATNPVQALMGRVIPQAKILGELATARPGKKVQSAINETPLLGGILRDQKRFGQAEQDDEFDRRPVSGEGVIQAARIEKGDWDRLVKAYGEEKAAQVAAQYEKEKTDFLKRIRHVKGSAGRPFGFSMYPVFYRQCAGRLTPEQLRAYANYYGWEPTVKRVEEEGYEEPLGSYYVEWQEIPSQTEGKGQTPHIPLSGGEGSIEQELEKRARGQGPMTLWQQMRQPY